LLKNNNHQHHQTKQNSMNLSLSIVASAKAWLDPFFDVSTHIKVLQMLANPDGELVDSFYKNLEFGTGGMRGVMGVGDNRLNKYTLGKTTQGLSNQLKRVFKKQQVKVVIAYDCRNNSQEFAKIVADVFSANGISVYLFSALRPTPELSFAIRTLNCQCGIVLTASHNPPEYNGYKVYWQDGGQIVPPVDARIMKAIEKLTYQDIKFEAQESLIQYIDTEMDEQFILSTLEKVDCTSKQESKNQVKIVFTSLHGTAITLVPQTLEKAGFSKVFLVEDQAVPDGNFPTVLSPNPEESSSLKMALDLAEIHQADVVIGTDPDGDRLGVAVRNTVGELVLLNGNQSMVLMSAFLLKKWQKEGKINGKQFIGSTLVSTPMLKKVAMHYGVQYKEGLTGFKWIAKMIEDFPELEFICGGEESFGFMIGDAVRDKDAVSATLLMCEIVAQAKENGSSVYEELVQLFVDFGCYKEQLLSITKKGKSGLEEISKMMRNLRNNPKLHINGSKLIRWEDYQTGIAYHPESNKRFALDLPKSNVLVYITEDGAKISVRPSGTEPKIKFYVSVQSPLASMEEYEHIENQLNIKIEHILNEFSF
jgi:phosphoglucomutase